MSHQPYLVICTDFEVVVDKKTSQGSKLRTIRLGNAYMQHITSGYPYKVGYYLFHSTLAELSYDDCSREYP